jgi:ligand-binding sensor domain-containing protein
MHKYIDTFTDTLRLFFLGFSFFCRPVLADEPHIALSEYFIETWSTKDGLPHNSINAIAQTREGYLWFGTWEGFARYNGKTFQIFERGGESGMPDSGRWRLSPGQTAACWLQARAVSHPGKMASGRPMLRHRP